MERKHIKICNYLVSWEWPYSTDVSIGLVYRKDGNSLFFFSDDVELIFFILEDQFFYFFIVRILFEFFDGKFFVVEQNLIERHKSDGRKTDQLDDISDSIVLIWIFDFSAVIFVFLFVSLDVIDPYLIGLIKT